MLFFLESKSYQYATTSNPIKTNSIGPNLIITSKFRTAVYLLYGHVRF
jgi:hypothetical protein